MSPRWRCDAGGNHWYMTEVLRPFSGVMLTGIEQSFSIYTVKANVVQPLPTARILCCVVPCNALPSLPAVDKSTDFRFPVHPAPSLRSSCKASSLWLLFACELEKRQGPFRANRPWHSVSLSHFRSFCTLCTNTSLAFTWFARISAATFRPPNLCLWGTEWKHSTFPRPCSPRSRPIRTSR